MSKYAVGRAMSWRNERDGRPRFADHVVGGGAEGAGRWDQRTPPGAVSPETAWERGVDLDDSVLMWFANNQGRVPEQCRLFAERVGDRQYAVLMPVIDGCVPTVLRVGWVDRVPRRSYLQARVAEVFGL